MRLQGCFDHPTGILQNKQVLNHIILFPHVSYAFQDQIACPSQALNIWKELLVLLQGCFDLPTGILQNKQVLNHIILFPHVSYTLQDQIACPSQALNLKLTVAFSFYDKWAAFFLPDERTSKELDIWNAKCAPRLHGESSRKRFFTFLLRKAAKVRRMLLGIRSITH